MARQLPKSLKGFTVYADGVGYLGRVSGGKLPVVKIKTEGYRDGGMDGEDDLDFGQEKMEWGFTLSELDPHALKLVGRRDVPIVLRGSQEGENGESEAVIGTMRGLVSEADLGEWKAGEPKTEAKLNGTANYYRLTIGGDEIYDIDIVAGVRRIGGTDQLAGRRANLGV